MTNNQLLKLTIRILGLSAASVALIYVFNNFLIFWWGWPGLDLLFGHLGWFGFEALRVPLQGDNLVLGWVQVFLYLGPVIIIILLVLQLYNIVVLQLHNYIGI